MSEPALFNFARDIVERWARERPDLPSIWWTDGSGIDLRLTYRELNQKARQAAHFFHRQGIGPGDRVMVILPRVPQWWVGMLGLIRLGAVPIPGTPLLTERDIDYRIKAAGASAVFTDAVGADKVKDFTGVSILASGGGRPGWSDFDAGAADASADFDPPPTAADDPGMLFFTSGTTGHAKMVLHTQASYGRGHEMTGKLWLDLRPGDLHWNLSDTGWAKAAWSSFFGPWHAGACVFALDTRGKFDAAATLDALERYPVTTWCAPPTALRLIVREDLGRRKFPTLRHCTSAGEPLNPEVIQAWKTATGLAIHEGYGQTESVVLCADVPSRGDQTPPGSMGRPMPGFDLAILDPDLNVLGPDAEGELAVRVKPHRPIGLFKEYWRNDAENSERFRGDWYLTGDNARRDTDGYYWFVGRADDVIKSSGYRIGPFEVESTLIEHPAVLEAAVVGRADELRGQIVKAFVVLRNDVVASETLKTQLQDHCRRLTAPYKYPREIEFVTELPKTISGKIRRMDLRRGDIAGDAGVAPTPSADSAQPPRAAVP